MAFAQEAALLKLDCRLVVPAQRWWRQLLVGSKPLGPDSGPGANAEWGQGHRIGIIMKCQGVRKNPPIV